MKRVFATLTLLLAVFFAGLSPVAIAAGPPDRAMGDVTGHVQDHPLWLHSFRFSAVGKGDILDGHGFLRHLRLEPDATTVRVDEVCAVEYFFTDGDAIWIACRVVYYYHSNPDPAVPTPPEHWIVIYVEDGGQPGGVGDVLYWKREWDGEDAALARLEEGEETNMTRIVITDGNLKVVIR